MYRLRALFGVLVLFPVTAVAQIPKVNIFVGYSFNHADLNAPTGFSHGQSTILSRGNLNGWNASVEGKLIPLVGFVADFGGHYGSPSFNAPCDLGPPPVPCTTLQGKLNARLHTFLFGPQLSFSIGRLRPFAHALFGAAHVNEKVPLDPSFSLSLSDTSFAYALGGGFDYKLAGPLGWRVQGDFLHTRLFEGTSTSSLTFSQNNARLSTGIVFRF